MNPIKTLILIEDNPDDIDLALKAFQPFMDIRHIQTAHDGKEALNLMESWKDGRRRCPFLILLDLNLPKVNGFELLRALKTDKDLAQIPVVILTSSSEESDIRQAYHLGTNSYLNKPADYSGYQRIATLIHYYWNCLNMTV